MREESQTRFIVKGGRTSSFLGNRGLNGVTNIVSRDFSNPTAITDIYTLDKYLILAIHLRYMSADIDFLFYIYILICLIMFSLFSDMFKLMVSLRHFINYMSDDSDKAKK